MNELTNYGGTKALFNLCQVKGCWNQEGFIGSVCPKHLREFIEQWKEEREDGKSEIDGWEGTG